MPATSFHTNTAYNSQESHVILDSDLNSDLDLDIDEGDLRLDDLEDEIAAVDSQKIAANLNRRSTDLVRLYLQEIGRVRLLGRDEEVSEAQKVRR